MGCTLKLLTSLYSPLKDLREYGEAGRVLKKNKQNILKININQTELKSMSTKQEKYAPLKENSRKNRHSGNLSEALLWQKLSRNQLNGLHFSRQRIIGNYIVDFYCASQKTIIEIDGYSHETKGDYDERREEFLKSKGFKIIHIQDADIKDNLSEVCANLELYFNQNPYSKPPKK